MTENKCITTNLKHWRYGAMGAARAAAQYGNHADAAMYAKAARTYNHLLIRKRKQERREALREGGLLHSY